MISDSLIFLMCASSVYNHVSCCVYYWHCIHEFLDSLNLVPCSWHVLIHNVIRSMGVNVCVTSWSWRPVVPACTARNESDWLVLRSSPTSRATQQPHHFLHSLVLFLLLLHSPWLPLTPNLLRRTTCTRLSYAVWRKQAPPRKLRVPWLTSSQLVMSGESSVTD